MDSPEGEPYPVDILEAFPQNIESDQDAAETAEQLTVEAEQAEMSDQERMIEDLKNAAQQEYTELISVEHTDDYIPGYDQEVAEINQNYADQLEAIGGQFVDQNEDGQLELIPIEPTTNGERLMHNFQSALEQLKSGDMGEKLAALMEMFGTLKEYFGHITAGTLNAGFETATSAERRERSERRGSILQQLEGTTIGQLHTDKDQELERLKGELDALETTPGTGLNDLQTERDRLQGLINDERAVEEPNRENITGWEQALVEINQTITDQENAIRDKEAEIAAVEKEIEDINEFKEETEDFASNFEIALQHAAIEFAASEDPNLRQLGQSIANGDLEVLPHGNDIWITLNGTALKQAIQLAHPGLNVEDMPVNDLGIVEDTNAILDYFRNLAEKSEEQLASNPQ